MEANAVMVVLLIPDHYRGDAHLLDKSNLPLRMTLFLCQFL